MLIDYHKVNIYQQDKLILHDVDFHAEEGEFIYLIGKGGIRKRALCSKHFIASLTFPRKKQTLPKFWDVI